jgi:peptidoglycan/LPS O-acetylase OafA/YrhL
VKLNPDRIEGLTLTVILTIVAVAAGWASFTHVHDWTMRHVPTGTPDAFGWVNAVISELVPVAALLTIKRRRRAGAPIGYPLFLLIAAATLSLAAQLAVAQPSPSGWLLSAVPALAFMALVKLVFTGTPQPTEPRPAQKETTSAVPTSPPPVAPAALTRPIARPNGVPVIGQVTR